MDPTGGAETSPSTFGADAPTQTRKPAGWVPLLLLLLALLDLRTEGLLLLDHPTVTALVYALQAHPLAVLVLGLQPSLWRRYGRGKASAGLRRPGGNKLR